MANKRIRMGMDLSVNNNDLKLLQQSLTDISVRAKMPGAELNKELQEAALTAQKLSLILEQSSNKDLGTINLTRFNTELQKAELNLNSIKKGLLGAKDSGATAFNSLASSILKTNIKLKESNKLLNEMATSFANTVKWGISSNVFNTLTSSVQKAYDFSVKLDTSLNDIRIVTGKSADEMERFAEQANEAAKELGASTRDYAEASLIYYQQGLGDEEVAEKTDITLKTANVTGQTGAEVSEQLTAIWNGYKVSAEEAELYIDKVAAVAAATAADLEELSTGMGKVASAAYTMGVDIDQMNALLATGVSVTREAPETIGTAFRSIFSRMGQLQTDGTDEFGVTLGKISGQMQSMGIEILDQQGNMRDMGDVITEVGEKWQGWTEAQKVAAAQAMAGTQQYSRLMAVFNNWDMYEKALITSQNALGTLNKQQAIQMESTEAHLQQLRTTWEDLYLTIFDQEAINGALDALSQVVSTFDSFLESFGGGAKSISAFGAVVVNIFNKQISGAISKSLIEYNKYKENLAQLQLKQATVTIGAASEDKRTKAATPEAIAKEAELREEIRLTEKILQVQSVLTDEQYQQLNNQQKEIALLEQQAALIEAKAAKNAKGLVSRTEILDPANEDPMDEFDTELFSRTEAVEITEKHARAVEKVLEGNKKIATFEQEHLELTQQLENLYKSLNAKTKERNKANSKVSESTKKELKELTKVVKNSKEYSSNIKERQKISDKVYSITKKIREEEDKSLKLAEKRRNAAQGILDADEQAQEIRQKKNRLETDEGGFDEIIDNAQTTLTVGAQISSITNAVSILTTAWGSLNTVISVWNDDSLSFGDKTISTLTTLIALIPTVKAAYQGYHQILQAGAAIEARNVALQTMDVALDKQNLANMTLEQATTAILNASKGAHVKLQQQEVLQRLKNAGLIKTENDSKVVSNLLTVQGTGTNIGFVASLKLVAIQAEETWAAVLGPLYPIIKALTIATVALGGLGAIFYNIYSENKKQAREANNQAIEAMNKTKEEINQNLALYDSYLKVAQAYKDNTAEKEDMIKAAESLGAAIDQELVKIAKLTGNYDLLTEAVKKAKAAALTKQESTLTGQLVYAQANLTDTSTKGEGRTWTSGGENYVVDFNQGPSSKDDKKAQDILATTVTGFHRDGNYAEVSNTLEEIVALYDDYVEAMRKMREAGITNESELYKEVEDYISKMKDDVEVYRQIIEDLNNIQIEKKVTNEEDIGYLDFNTTDYSQFQLNREALIKYIGELEGYGDKTQGELAQIADSYIKNVSASADNMLTKIYTTNMLVDKFGEESRDKIDKVLNDLSFEDVEMLLEIGVDELKSLENLDKYIERVQLEVKRKKIEANIEIATDTINTLMDGDDLDEEQLAALKQLEDEYYNLTGINENLSSIQDKSSDRYLEKLRKIQDALEEQRTQIAKNNSSKLLEDLKDIKLDVNVTADDEQFQDTMKDIAEAEYEVLVSIKTDVQSDFDNIVNKMTNIEDTASKIGDNFIVSANDLEEVNDVFPGILNNMTLLKDGTAQLSEESVQTAIATAQKELEIDTQETVKELENERDKLLSKQQSALKIAEIARKLANKESTIEKEQQTLNKELDNLTMQNADTTADYEKDTQKDVADSSVKNANAMAANFSGAYKKMAEDSKAWADAAKKNMLAARLGFGKTTSGSFTPDYVADQQGTNITTAEKGDLSGTEDLTTVTDWEEVATYYEELAESYRLSANNVQGKIAKILGRNNALNITTSNIGKGLGSDGETKETKEEIAEVLEMLEDEADIYHDIDIEIQKNETSLKRLQNQQEKVYGANLINNLNEQLKILDKQTNDYAEKIKIASIEAASLRALLDANGVTFNADGTISNYKQAFENQKQVVDDLRAQYNKMTKEEQEAFEETLDKAEDKFETFQDNIKEYDEIITDLIPGLEDDIQEALDQQMEIEIEKFNMEIETRLEMSQAERDWNEFKKKVIDGIDDDDILGNAKANLEDFSSYYKDNFEGVIQVNTDHVNDILFELSEMDKGLASEYYGDNRTKALEDLKTYYTQLMDDLTAVEELSEEIRQSYLDMMDEAQEAFDEQVSTYEQIADLIDHDMKLIELLKGEESYSELGKYYNKLEENNLSQLDFQRQQVEFWKAQMDSAKEGTEQWDKAKENWTAAVTDWKSLVNDSIETLKDKYLNTISEIFERLNNEVTSGFGLEYVNEEWSLINRNAEEYLDTINAMYGIQELSNKYLDAIDQTDSISAQQELNKLMEQEIAALEEKDKLTQYDIDRANMRYDIALKQIALEEAQQNKTSMRLRRDSQGNYSYQFVADEDAVGAAEDELAAAQNELYNFDKEKYINNLDELYAAYEEYQEKMFEAAQINDPDERAQRELLINEQYGELINGLVEQNQTIRSNLHESAFDELARLYDTDVANYRQMSEEERNILLNEMIPQWTSGVQQMADTFAGEGGLGEVCKGALEELSQATEDYKTDLEEVEEASGITFEEIVSGTDDAITETEDLLKINDELIEQYEDELDAIDAVITELDKLIEKFAEAKQAAIEASEAAYEYAQAADDDMADEAFEDRDYSADMTRAILSGYTTDSSYYKSLARRRDKKIAESDVETDVTSSRLKKVFDAYLAGNSNAQIVVNAVNSGQADYTDDFLDAYGFKTGGYTGDWAGETGRLAMLHQKELVLNAEDTQNMLGAIQVLRNITDLVGDSVLRRAANMNSISAPSNNTTNNSEILEQDVHIDAHFPNVTNSKEVEDALNNLMNTASQRALRKK